MLWQGQELGADNVVPDRGFARIGALRPMPWELFYDEYRAEACCGWCAGWRGCGQHHPQFQSGAHHFHNDWEPVSVEGGAACSHGGTRSTCRSSALNFSEQDVTRPIHVRPERAVCRDAARAGQFPGDGRAGALVDVPRHYGRNLEDRLAAARGQAHQLGVALSRRGATARSFDSENRVSARAQTVPTSRSQAGSFRSRTYARSNSPTSRNLRTRAP